jgi:hypothetical protein
MTFEELAWEFVEIFDDLEVDAVNEMLVKNVPIETLEFFTTYTDAFGKSGGLSGSNLQRLPKLMLIGYLLRLLEEQLIVHGPTGH